MENDFLKRMKAVTRLFFNRRSCCLKAKVSLNIFMKSAKAY